MITFETKMLPDGLWQYRAVGKLWSKPLSLTRCMVEMRKVAKNPPEEKGWSKPLVVGLKRKHAEVTDTVQRYEIAGGKVRRIAATAKERQAQEVDELLAALEALDA